MSNRPYQEHLNAMAQALRDKGYLTTPRINLHIESDSRPNVQIYYTDAMDERQYETFFPDTLHDDNDPMTVISDAWHWINYKLQNKHDARRIAFLQQAAKMLDTARELGFDTGMTAPLEELVKRLSENVIEHKKDGEQ